MANRLPLPQDSVPFGSRSPRRSGWLVGILCGVMAGLLVIPRVRSTLLSQLEFAFAEDNIPFVRAMDLQSNTGETQRLDAVAAMAPDDYLIQVGRATVLATSGGVRHAPLSPSPSEGDHTLHRLALVAHGFAWQPGAYAHLARYMMLDRIRIERPELSSHAPLAARSGRPVSPPPRQPGPAAPLEDGFASAPRLSSAQWRAFTLTEWALKSGESRDPGNAFWPAMLAATYFSARRDTEALNALGRVTEKGRWDAFIYEEVLGQWRLYSAAYGDHGATQKIGPLSLVAFPHLRELRRMSEMARLYAEQAAAQGRIREALRIRRDLSRLGLTMRDRSQWAYEALFGTELYLIANTDSGAATKSGSVLNVDLWQKEATQYLGLLQRAHRSKIVDSIREEVQLCCDLRDRLDLARADASYPGIPPGIPLASLFGNWMAGICLLQQILALSAAALLSWFWYRHSQDKHVPWVSGQRLRRRLRVALVVFVAIATGASGCLLFYGEPSPRTAMILLLGMTILIVLAIHNLYINHDAPKSLTFHPSTILWMLLSLLIPALTALFCLRPYLSGLHPVAILLTSLTGMPRPQTPVGAMTEALLATALPLAIVLMTCLWAWRHRLSPLMAALLALRRMFLPTVACLFCIYLLLLNLTLRLDAATSHAINEAAQNDLQWVLTHSTE
jgi:hypothetical protein